MCPSAGVGALKHFPRARSPRWGRLHKISKGAARGGGGVEVKFSKARGVGVGA